MEIFKSYMVTGDSVELKATNPKHFGFHSVQKNAGGSVFADELGTTFKGELSKVNDLQLTSDEMLQKLAVSPNEVNIHDVVIASEKARLALEFTKAIRDKLVSGYQTLVNMR